MSARCGASGYDEADRAQIATGGDAAPWLCERARGHCGGHALLAEHAVAGVIQWEGSVAEHDAVEHPQHYTAHPSGIECVQITEHMGFLLGNVIKYVWRADLKGDAIEDLRKARWYLDREIAKREASS